MTNEPLAPVTMHLLGVMNKITKSCKHEQHILDIGAAKQLFLSCLRYLTNTGVDKMNNIYR